MKRGEVTRVIATRFCDVDPSLSSVLLLVRLRTRSCCGRRCESKICFSSLRRVVARGGDVRRVRGPNFHVQVRTRDRPALARTARAYCSARVTVFTKRVPDTVELDGPRVQCARQRGGVAEYRDAAATERIEVQYRQTATISTRISSTRRRRRTALFASQCKNRCINRRPLGKRAASAVEAPTKVGSLTQDRD